jgi:outer membrane autotransporter protein
MNKKIESPLFTAAKTRLRNLVLSMSWRASLGLAALGWSSPNLALAQSTVSTDPASWRTPEYRADWGLEAMRAADAYAAGYTGLGVTVGVVDSGLYSAHPEFADGRVKALTITGTFGSDGYYFMDGSGAPDDRSPQPSFFRRGEAYNVPGTYDSAFNDPHGTHVSGSIAASRNGVGMQGVAFDATVYVTNTHATDESIYGANADYAYFKNAYGSLAAAGARAINSSWGSPPPTDNYNTLPGLRQAYTKFEGQLGYVDALSDVAKQYGIIQVFAAGNTGWDNPNVRSSLPYFRPEIEKNWLAVGAAGRGANGSTASEDLVLASYSNRAGAAKYWYVVAPGDAINSTAPTYTQGAVWSANDWGIDPNHQTGYTTVDGTSMAAPHATGALAVIMQRYPYMTNTQARDVLLTTAYHRDAVDGVPDANPNAPNAVWGWGVIDLDKAMRGPGQVLGPVAANLPAGMKDTWSNDISEDALIQRRQENDAETAAWATRKAALDPRLQTPVLTAGLPASRTALDGVVSALRNGSQSAILGAITTAIADPVANQVLATFVRSNGYDGVWPLTDPAYASSRADAGNLLNTYLSGLTDADYDSTIAFIVRDWKAETRIETTRIASFADMPTQGSLIKLGLGTLTLSGTNTFSGGVVLAGGTLSVARDANLGAARGPLAFDGGTLQVTGTAFTATTRPITWGQNGGGLDIADPANTFTLAQALSGPGSLTKLGPGTLTLAGTNTYSGPTTLAAGTLLARGGQAIGDLSAVTVAAGATLALADSETVGSLAGQGRVALGAARLTAGGDGTSTTFAGTLDGTGGLTKAGAGTLTLTAAHSFTGPATLTVGGLSLTATASLAAPVLTRPGTTLLNAGTLAGGLTNAGTALNTGAIAGGVANLGSLTTSGTIVGGLTNTGTVLASAGRIDGAIRNAAGILTISGPVVSDGTLANAAGASLAVTGTYRLSGSLTNTGIVALAPTGSLTAPAGLSNAGSLTNAGTITGSLANAGQATNSGTITGGLTNAGTVTASAGRIDGAIRNEAGLFTVSGTVTSDGTLANAAGATLAVAGTYSLSGRLTSTGTVTVAPTGSLTARAGLRNAGSLFNSGILAGGLTNTGIVTASAGRIDGAIRNDAGTLAVTGAVASDGTLANAAGATLAVTGTYSLAGQLTNAGTVAVTDGGRFLAAGIANAGLLTVAQNASVVDDLLNTGRLVNAGSYTADAVNAAGATLVNTGTFTTVSTPFANSGTLISSGTLTGGLANTGIVQASGVLAGAVSNAPGATIAVTGPTTGITRLTNDGSVDLGRTDLAIGSLAGSTPGAVLGNGQLTVGGDGASTLYAGRIVDGAMQTSLTKVGPGTLTLSGFNALSGPVRVLGGELAVTEALPNAALAIGPGSLLTGEARFGSVSLGTGATLAPGIGAGALGRISVAGNLSLAPGALYRVDATADGRADRIDVGGSATVAGATVQAVAGTGQYAPRTRYTILTAAGGVQGRFAGVSSNFAFLTPFLGYAPDVVTLTLARNDLDFSAAAQTRNQSAVAGAVQAGAVGSPLYDAVAVLSAPQARAAFAALSGDGHATLASMVFANAGLLREAVLDRLRWDTAPAARPGDLPEPAVSLWGQGLGSVGHVRTDGNAAGLSHSSAGFLLGLDARVDTPLGALRMGAVGGNLESSFASPAQVQTGALASTFGGIYGSLEAGSAVLRFGALAADDPAQLRRVVAFPGLSDSAMARLSGHSVQGFGQAGYRIGLSEAVELEPFAGGAVVSVTRERFGERGGAATLAGFGQEHTMPSATMGLRVQAQLDRDGSAPAFVHGMIAYRRSFGELVTTVPLAFRGTGARFTSRGLPLDRDALVSEVGLKIMLAPGLSAGLSYTGQLGVRAQDHAAKGSLVYKF